MPDLILLCAGAATERAAATGADTPSPDPVAVDARPLAQRLQGGNLERGLRRARIAADSSDESALPRELAIERWLRDFFGVAERDSVSAWAAASHRIAPPCWRAAPVHAEVGRYEIVLADPSGLELDAAQAAALADAALPVLEGAGFRLLTPAPNDWYLVGNDDWELDASSREMAVGRSIDGHLPRGPRARDWRRIFTEVQMAWYEHPVNEAREARGQRPVNAIWLDGRVSRPLQPRPVTVFSDDPGLAGLAIAAGGEHREAASFDFRAPAGAPGDVVVHLDAWHRARLRGDPGAWLQAWECFDAWLRPLASGAVPAGFDRVRLVASAERRVVELLLERRDRLRVWHRFDPVAALLKP